VPGSRIAANPQDTTHPQDEIDWTLQLAVFKLASKWCTVGQFLSTYGNVQLDGNEGPPVRKTQTVFEAKTN